MTARLAAAWQLRHNLHAWLREHPGSVMQDVFDAFPDALPNTLRKCMQKLVRDLDVAMVNTTGNKSRYRAITEQIRPLAETIERVREAGRRNQHHAVRGCLVKAGKVAPIDDAIAKAKAEMAELIKAKREAERIERMKAKQRAADAKRAARIAKQQAEDEGGIEQIAPGHILYRPGRRPLQNQGGHGAVRRPVTVNCSIDW